jgi:hypothetical protein
MCSFVCCVSFERGVICLLCLIVLPLPPGKNPSAVKTNDDDDDDDNNSNNNKAHRPQDS